MKPLNRKNYGSIPHLSNSKLGEGDHFIHSGQEKILTIKVRDKHDEVFIFEKYDGSNVGVCKVNNRIFALTRSGYEAKTSPYSQHHIFNDWANSNLDIFDSLLLEGERIVGEWLIKSHGLKYSIVGDPIVFFDIFNNNNERYGYDYLKNKCDIHGLNTPRLLHRGSSISTDKIECKLNNKTDTIRSEEKPEGMVYRVERKGSVDFLAKWVRSDFTPGKYIIGKEESEQVFNTIRLPNLHKS